MKNFTIFLFLIIFLTSSCTIEKMRYSRGYHIEWMSKQKKVVSAKKIRTQVPRINSGTMPKSEETPFETDEKNIEIPVVITISSNENLKEESNLISIRKQNITAQNKNIQEKYLDPIPENFSQKKEHDKSEKTQLVGLALILVGLLLGLLGLVFFTILGVFFGPIFLVIFLIGAAVYIVAGLLSLIF